MTDDELVVEHQRRDAIKDAQNDASLRHVEFKVIGQPVPQSGMRAFNTPAGTRLTTTGGAGLKEWRTQLAEAAHERRTLLGVLTGPLGLDVTFRFRMPQSRLKRQRELLVIPHAVRPDLDKLVRAVFDGLKTGGLIVDDAQIASLTTFKCEVLEDWVGVDIRLRQLPTMDRYLW